MNQRHVVRPQVMVVAAAALMLGPLACSKWNEFGKDAERICTKAVQDDYSSLADAAAPIVPYCVREVVEAVTPCRNEYRYGTDSAIKCIDERTATPLRQLKVLTVHAIGSLNKMWEGALGAFERENAFPTGRGDFTPEVCHGVTSDTEMAKLFAEGPWKDLAFSPDKSPEIKFLQFQFRSSGKDRDARFISAVAINPNCAGRKLYFSRPGRINKDGDIAGIYNPYVGEELPKW
jgi:hypothetical protein